MNTLEFLHRSIIKQGMDCPTCLLQSTACPLYWCLCCSLLHFSSPFTPLFMCVLVKSPYPENGRGLLSVMPCYRNSTLLTFGDFSSSLTIPSLHPHVLARTLDFSVREYKLGMFPHPSNGSAINLKLSEIVVQPTFTCPYPNSRLWIEWKEWACM